MLDTMTPEQFNEQIAFDILSNEEPEDRKQISVDDPHLAQNFLGFDPNGLAR